MFNVVIVVQSYHICEFSKPNLILITHYRSYHRKCGSSFLYRRHLVDGLYFCLQVKVLYFFIFPANTQFHFLILIRCFSLFLLVHNQNYKRNTVMSHYLFRLRSIHCKGCGIPYVRIFIRDPACFHCDSMNCESLFTESQWKHAVSRMKMPAVRGFRNLFNIWLVTDRHSPVEYVKRTREERYNTIQ